jgi:hypothetical protein
VLLAACSGAQPVEVQPPDRQPGGCEKLHDALPEDLDGRDRRDTSPESAQTAAWGDPAVVLRCGVGRPAGLTPTSQVLEVDGVDWFLVERPDAFVFTTTGRRAYVEVRVPGSTPREQATAPLVDLAEAVRTTLPRV